MGIRTYIVKPTSLEYYDLGKGFRTLSDSIFSGNIENPRTLDCSVEELYEDLISHKTDNWSLSGERLETYFRKVAEDLHKWCSSDKVVITSDAYLSDIDYPLCKCTGSRYSEPCK